jgi:hypothetical protein
MAYTAYNRLVEVSGGPRNVLEMSGPKEPKYFSDVPGEPEPVLLTKGVWAMPNKEYDQKFPGIKARRYDSFHRRVGKSEDGRVLPLTRVILYSKTPSLHKCNARCLNAKPESACECSCGGKNHGRGNF